MQLAVFDARIQGVMYLGRLIKEVELLQSIARVNRTGHGKSLALWWIIIVANHLKATLVVCSDDDIKAALRGLKDEIPALRARHISAVDMFRSRGVEKQDDVGSCMQMLCTERLRQEFLVKLKDFLQSLEHSP